MRMATIVLHLLIAFVVTATAMPGLLAAIPAIREPATGISVAGLLAALTFVLSWLLWPRRRSQ